MATALIGALGARLYSLGSDGRIPLADAPKIIKGVINSVASCLKLPPKNFYSEYIWDGCYQG